MTEVLESSAIEATPPPIMEVERGPLVNLTPEQRADYRKTGELPTAPKNEESATSSAQGVTEPPKQQGKPKEAPNTKQTAEERIAQLEATIEKISKGAGIERKPKAESTPAIESKLPLSAKPTPDDKKSDGTSKFSTHEDYIEALTDWKWEQRESEKAATESAKVQNKALIDKVDEGRTRYENLDEVIQPAANEIYQDAAIPMVIKSMIGDSPLIVDLVYTIGSDKAELAKFVKMAKEEPGKAIRYIALTESLIAQELESKAKPVSEEVPAKPKTQAPKPPAEAGGRAAAPPDSLKAALEGSGGKLNSGLKAEFLRRDLARLKS